MQMLLAQISCVPGNDVLKSVGFESLRLRYRLRSSKFEHKARIRAKGL